MEYAVELRNLHYTYSCGTEVLHGISSTLDSGRIFALFGPNGSGKSTLLKCIAGLFVPSSGEILVNGKNILTISSYERSKVISFVPQEHQLSFPFLVEEIVLMGRTPYIGGIKGPTKEDVDLAMEALETIGISDLVGIPYTNLSGGQRQLVLIARALAQDTPIVILDEPTSALDFKNQMLVWDTLKILKENGKTVIVCSHDPNHVLWFSDEVLVLESGNLIRVGKASEVINDEVLSILYGPIFKLSDGVIHPKK